MIEFKFCEDTRPQSQKEKAQEQHAQLVTLLKNQGYHKVKLQIILCGVVGTIYTDLTNKPLLQLGLEYHQVKQLTHTLNKEAVKSATQIINTRYNLASNKIHVSGSGVGLSASARNPPDPH